MIVIIFGVFVVLLLFPLLSGMYRNGSNKELQLYINQNKVRNPRYFAQSFCQLFDEKWENYDGSNTIELSHKDSVIVVDESTKIPKECNSIVFIENKTFDTEEGTSFNKEIYAKEDCYIHGTKLVRAVYCKKDLIIGYGTIIVRWADAERTVRIYDNCDLGISVSSGKKITIGKNCSFRRLYSPLILIGWQPDEEDLIEVNNSLLFELDSFGKIERNIRYINDSMADNDGIVRSSVISKHEVVVLENIIVKGHIKSHKTVRICDNSIVCGNIFAEGKIFIGENVRVLGSIFTQGDIEISKNTVIGQQDRIISIIAVGSVYLHEKCIIYGKISCEKRGCICKGEVSNSSDKDKNHGVKTKKKTTNMHVENEIIFKNIEEYNITSLRKFRHNYNIEKVIIPEGVKKIDSSMFYCCKNLRNITLPSTIEHIGEFAFYGCESLNELCLNNCSNLIYIGKSAFERCLSLSKIKIPSLVKEINNAAFLGCTNLEEVDFHKNSQLKSIGTHAFKDCEQLERIVLPPRLKKIGMSSFYNCKSLKEVYIPSTIEITEKYAFDGCSYFEVNNSEKLLDLGSVAITKETGNQMGGE